MRLRLIISFAIVVLVSIATVVLIARQGAANEVRAFMFRGGMAGAEDLVSALEAFYASQGSWQDVGDLLGSMGGGAGHGPGMGGQHGMGGMMGQRLRLADAQGKIAADTDLQGSAGVLNQTELERAIVLQVDGKTVGYLLPEGGMAFSPGDETRLVSRITHAALIAGLVAGGVSLLLALALAYRLLRPVRELTRAAEKMAKGDLSQRVPIQGDDELAVLGKAFNRMAETLQLAEQSRRSMTADIAHELRNPLAVQRASLEAMQDGIYPLTPENLAPILEQNALLNHLVDDLRTLALADAGQLKLEIIPTDLKSLVERVVERFSPQALSQSIHIEVTYPKANFALIPVDPLRVEQIIGNLLSNALRYTPAQGRIEIGLSQMPSAVQIAIRDSGPGIPDEAFANLFERFYRSDRSRSRAEGGTGLGLAIARQLARAHGGDLTAANHPEGGAIFTLLLPTSSHP
jgi:signal transduction histidine kinase